jgi:uncharacterized membrane protein (DUF2068 family)
LLKALFLIAGGFATLKLLRPGMAETVMRWVENFPVMTGHAFLERTTAKLTRLPPRRIEELAIAEFAYAAVFIAEGTGLVLRRVWAEWLTVVVTTSFIPFEVYETFKRMTPIRVGLLVINIAIVIYLIWRRVESRRHEGHTRFFHRRS